MKITIRAFVYGQREPLFTDSVETGDGIDGMAEIDIDSLARRHAQEHDLANRPHAIEIEFPPMGQCPAQYFRIGTDPRLLKIPLPLHSLNDEGLQEIIRRQERGLRAHLN